jgi:hypothetical protein
MTRTNRLLAAARLLSLNRLLWVLRRPAPGHRLAVLAILCCPTAVLGGENRPLGHCSQAGWRLVGLTTGAVENPVDVPVDNAVNNLMVG